MNNLKLWIAALLASMPVAAMLAHGTTAAAQSTPTLSSIEAADCRALANMIDGQVIIMERWRVAVRNMAESGHETDRGLRNFNNMQASANRAIDAINNTNGGYERQCLGVRITRSTFNAVCGNAQDKFCAGFDF
ncbi:hypothetical protein [Sphingomicrobium sediminis]|uniref:UrcA family protein n=1 Tax=Sphingomicrobium sediminis TaxID=2950949 RepID=A0A9X2J1G2_9SPHN|nr:hypothetical protein [Sphingomicrobium sediminis]MCM8557228.1 hypothetical protein [Sphingomicrobium sediminis]